MKTLAGYADRISVAPGDTLKFMVSCEDGSPQYRARLVRLICTDDHPGGPGLVERPVPSKIDGTYRARRQIVRPGSFVLVPRRPALDRLNAFTVQAMIWPTMPGKGRQTLLGTWSEADRSGFALELDDSGTLALRLGDGSGGIAVASTEQPMLAHEWYLVAASFDPIARVAMLWQRPLLEHAGANPTAERRSDVGIEVVPADDGPLLIGAHATGATVPGHAWRPETAGHFDGKIDSPRLADRLLSFDEIVALRAPRIPPSLQTAVVAAWDFSRGIDGETVVDLSPSRLDGVTVNLPARGMKGWSWSGSAHDWKAAPDEYGAIHFHADDLYDAGWETDFELAVPPDMPSGLYAARLEGRDEPEHVVFYVRPPTGKPRAKVAFLASTATYMAYGNYRVMNCSAVYEAFQGALMILSSDDLLLNDHPEYGDSLYGLHPDGSGICYSSRLRPLLNMRPNRPLWDFNGDGYLIAWLDAMGYEVDIVTDEDLHREGLDLLRPYRAVLTGCHPEYWSREMWDALAAYAGGGGRLMYLGGNGFYRRIAYHRTKPGVIEVRRAEDGTRAWAAEPGEHHMSFTGEYGGMWRRQDRTPNGLVGIGFSAQGFDVGSYYRRTDASLDPRAAFIFAGIGRDEKIGDFGYAGGGAAGQEIDRYDRNLGSPPHALVLASSENHTDNMLLANEEFHSTSLMVGGTENPKVRADMVFFETGGGGAVFSTGSISWCASLAWNRFDNNVSRITRNVLDRFLDPTPFAPARALRRQDGLP